MKVSEWCDLYGMKFNARKTQTMIVSRSRIMHPPNAGYPARGRVGRVTDCGVGGLGFKSPGSILTSRTETSSLSRVVRDEWDPCSVPLSG